MRETTRKTRCEICGRRCSLSRRQRESYKKIPGRIKSVWDRSFGDADAKARFFGPKAKEIDVPRWTPFPELPEEPGKAAPRRVVLTKADEAQLFLRYNYARFRLSELAEKQRGRPTKARAVAMLRWHDRVQKIRDSLVNANMSLVLAMTKRSQIPNVDFQELVSEGSAALLRAIESFDVSRGYKFSTYACRAILKGFNRMATKASRYYSRFGTPYEPDLERSDEDARRHEMQRARVVDDVREIVAKNLANLSEVERTIVVERFGLGQHGKGRTLAEVGKTVVLSSERVRQVQKAALAKIREALNERCRSA